MRILIIGSGGRRNTRSRGKSPKARASPNSFARRATPDIAALAECVPIPATEIDDLAAFAVAQKIDLTVVGPERPLCAGHSSTFSRSKASGYSARTSAPPNWKAARFSARDSSRSTTSPRPPPPFSMTQTMPAPTCARWGAGRGESDGLAAGKGVIVAASVGEAEQAITEIMERKIFGAAGRANDPREGLHGEELSVMALVDGQTFQVLASAQDHKARSTAIAARTRAAWERIRPRRCSTTLTGQVAGFSGRRWRAAAEGIDYRCSVRGFDDHPTRAAGAGIQLPFWRSRNPGRGAADGFRLVDAAKATLDGTLDRLTLEWRNEAAVCVVMAAGGYRTYQRNSRLRG